MIGLGHYLTLSTILFAVGMVGILKRKNLLMLFFSVEIVLNAINVGFVAISKYHYDLSGQLFAFFIIAIAASEVAVGLGLLIAMYKRKGTLNLDAIAKMNG